MRENRDSVEASRTGDREGIETAGRIEVEIPAVVSPDGRVNANLSMNKSGEDVTDVGVIYDSWYGEEGVPLALIKVKVTIDLDEVFRRRVEEGKVSVEEVDFGTSDR